MAEPLKENTGSDRSGHSERFSIDALARAQGVLPVDDLDEACREWPGNEDDPNDLIEFIRRERQERREATARKPSME